MSPSLSATPSPLLPTLPSLAATAFTASKASSAREPPVAALAVYWLQQELTLRRGVCSPHPPLPPGTPRRTHSAPTPSAPPGPSRTASTVRRRPAICQAPPLLFLLPSAPWLKLPLAVVPCRLSVDHQGPAGSKHERVGRSQRPSHPLLPDPDGRRVHKGRLRNAVAGLRRRLEPHAS